VSSLAARCRRR